jgi:acyl-CoA thioester hydrolase
MADTDGMGIVYHGNYLAWFEAARNELIRAWGVPYRLFMEQGLAAMVIGAELKWNLPARFDDLLEVRAEVEEFSPLRFTFRYRVLRQEDEKLLCEGVTRHVWVNGAGRPTPLTKGAPELWERLRSILPGGPQPQSV